MKPASVHRRDRREPIAIVGIGCRLPGGITNPSSFWQFLCDKRDAISEIPSDRWSLDGFYDPEPGKLSRSRTKWGGFLKDLYGFDPAFFDISPREVETMDPQQTGLLQVVYEAMQDAGLPMTEASRSTTGVFVGITTSDFRSLLEADRMVPHNDIFAGTGVALCIAANRISHRFNLTGPSIATDTACSSSMVAVDLACRSLQDGSSDMAIAAGVNVLISPAAFVIFSNANMMSPTGRLATFDARANGYVRGEGFGAVLLKPLSRALADNDRIYGLIRATAVNQDGRTKTLTSPSQAAQIAMLEKLCRDGQIDPASVGFVEAHGTGTPTGDPIEAGAVGRVFGTAPRRGGRLMIGSVKPNVGHLESAAGITGLIKGALAAYHGQVPPNINFETPNPAIAFDALNLEVPRTVQPLPTSADGAFVVVNSFGFGGTNASALIEAWRPERHAPAVTALVSSGTAATDADGPIVLPLSAATPESLASMAASLASELRVGALADDDIADVAATQATTRDHLAHRAAFVADDREMLADMLATFARDGAPETTSRDELPVILAGKAKAGRKIAFTFSGQGSQWWAMGRRLLTEDKAYAGAIAEFDRLFVPLAGWSVTKALSADEATSEVDRSAVTQPTICALQIALAAAWKARGVTPDYVIGHSLGEVAAAHVAGAIDLETAVRYIHTRSLIRSRITADGAMAVIGLPEEEVAALIAERAGLEIAGYNSATAITVSGDAAAVAALVADMGETRPDVMARLLKTDTAWHSHHLEPAQDWFRATVGRIDWSEPKIPFVSTVTGAVESRLDIDYWWRNLRSPVKYRHAVETALGLGATTFLELAPHRTLSGPTAQTAMAAGRPAVAVTSLVRGQDDLYALAAAQAALYVDGAPIGWRPATRRVALPLYPWCNANHTRIPHEAEEMLFEGAGHPLLGKRLRGPTAMWRAVVTQKGCRYLADHRMKDESLFPAAGYIEIMIAAGLELFGKGPIELEDIKIHETLFVPAEKAVVLQTVHDADRGALRIYSKAEDAGSEWVLRSESRVRQRDVKITAAMPAPIARPISYPRKFWYGSTDTLIQFGPSFQNLDNVLVETDGYRAIADVKVAPVLADRLAGYHAHPAVLDSSLQLTDHNIATLGASEGGSFAADGRFVGTTHSIPVAIRRVIWLAPLAAEMSLEVVHKVEGRKPVGNRGVFRTDSGEALVVVEGVTTKGIPVTQTQAEDDGTVRPSILCESYERVSLPTSGDGEDAGRFVLLADGALAEDLVAHLSDLGITADVVSSDGAPGDLAGLGARVADALDSGGPVANLVYAWTLSGGAVAADDVPAEAERHILALTAIGQVLDARPEPARPMAVTVLTERARRVPADGDMPLSGLVQAPLVGLARTIATECEAYPVVSLDVDGETAGDPAQLARLLTARHAEPELVVRGESAYAPRVARKAIEDLPATRRTIDPTDRTTNFVVTMKTPGVIDALEVREAVRPVIGADDVLLAIGAVGLNFRDIMAVTGLLPAEAEPEPAWLNLGLEYGATVVEVGANVTGLKTGDRVMGMGRRCLQRFMAMPASALTKLPDGLSLAEASTIPSAFVTAHYALNHVARLRKGERVLIHVATGGVGLAAIQLAQRAGAEIFATAGSEDKRAFLKSLGIRHVMSSRTLDFADEILEITGGKGVDVILNSLPSAYIKKGLDILAPYGRFIEIGKRDVYADSPIGMKALRKNVQFAVLDLAALGLERPDYMGEMLGELMAMFAAGDLKAIPLTEFPVSRSAEAFRYMSQAKHIGKVVVSLDDPEVRVAVSSSVAFSLKPGASYLVTGGSRGFGIAVADWLSARGAGRIVLASRSGRIDAAEAERVAGIRARGTLVDEVGVDVADAGAVHGLIARLVGDGKPLAGIIHGAAVIDDAMIGQLDDDHLLRVVRPKLAGAWHLNTAAEAAGAQLDFFLSFSSTAQVFGSRGQANYVAANAFLDALAEWRGARGLPASTVDWGPLGGSGFITRHEMLASYMESMGLHLVMDSDATAFLETVLRTDARSVAYTAIDWAKFRRANARLAEHPRLKPLIDGVEGGTAKTKTLVMTAAPAERPSLVQAFLAGVVAAVLKVEAAKLPVDRPLSELGLDSLSSFELMSRIEDELALSVSTSKFLQAPTIGKLADIVIELLEAELVAATRAEAETGEAPTGDIEGIDPAAAAVVQEADELLAAA